MNINPNTPVVVTTVRLPANLAAELRDLARREDRSVSGEVRHALSEHLRTKAAKPPETPSPGGAVV